jgi:ElaB/YqjD/DUF883 family membrane-anchored ribosome-binding protein
MKETALPDDTQELLDKIKQTRKHKEALPLVEELEEVLHQQEEQSQKKEDTLQVQITQLKEENKRLNRL